MWSMWFASALACNVPALGSAPLLGFRGVFGEERAQEEETAGAAVTGFGGQDGR